MRAVVVAAEALQMVGGPLFTSDAFAVAEVSFKVVVVIVAGFVLVGYVEGGIEVSCAKDADCCGRENGWEGQDPCTSASQAMTVVDLHLRCKDLARTGFAFYARVQEEIISGDR